MLSVMHLYLKHDQYCECLLCPHLCKISEGKRGVCRVRKNNGGKIDLLTYGVISGYAVDPVEKKPLYHFFPGHNILSAGSYGCNMRCDFCQNFNISQNVPENLIKAVNPEKITQDALLAKNNIGIAFTYNEPVIWFEFMRDAAFLAKNEGLFTVMVSNGYVNVDPLKEIVEFIDAFNIDLKAFNGNFYKKLTGVNIEPVKNTLRRISKSGRHLEITTLIIPGQNDNDKEMCMQSEWIAGELGNEIPLHLSRYYPMFRREDPATSRDTLVRLYEIASKKLKHVYIGNAATEYGQNTICPGCGTTVTIRSGFNIRFVNMDFKGKCNECGTLVYKYFTFQPSGN